MNSDRKTLLKRAIVTIFDRLRQAERDHNRTTGSVALLAVSKHFPVTDIRIAYELGLHNFGENYANELYEKAIQLNDLPHMIWHFIGPIQSNKIKIIAQHATWVHSVASLKHAQQLGKKRCTYLLEPLQICVQVNISGEAKKSGVAPHEVGRLLAAVSQIEGLTLRGLMCIAQQTDDTSLIAEQFKKMSILFLSLQKNYSQMDTLSMGMSSDLSFAVASGASLVRIGSALFGERS
ncbi:MAG: YggS family pyridoxal phosphate-dependent enzyme [Neisseriaceae bacterium]|nr:YggS family pyridoxal phosphate-dependent enzyme [Neisseriaceae bacterium]